MTDRYDKAIQDWYELSRTADFKYLDLAETPKPKNSDLAHNLAVIYDRCMLHAKISINDFHTLKNHLVEQNQALSLLKEETKDSFRKISKEIQQIRRVVEAYKPLTKQEIRDLVSEIVEQPKLVEKEALRITEELKAQIKEVKSMLHQIGG